MKFYNVAVKVVRGILHLMFKMEVVGTENVPKDGALIIAPNHLSNFDPPVLGAFLPVKMSYMAKEPLFRVPVLGRLIKALGAFPVKTGSTDISAVKMALKILKDDGQLVIFPEGRRSRTPGVLSPGKHGVVMIALKSGAKILPVGINATYKFRSRVKITIGECIDLCEYEGRKLTTEEQQEITDNVLMEKLSQLSGAKKYENISCG